MSDEIQIDEKIEFPGLELDLERVSALQWAQFVDVSVGKAPTLEARIVTQAEFLARIAKRCPADWGKADQPGTYSNRPIFEFQKMIDFVFQEVGDFRKKAKRP